MLEDEADTGIPHFVADNISWLYPVDPKKINCAVLLRENKSLASANLPHCSCLPYALYITKNFIDNNRPLQMLRDFCQNSVQMNNPQSEVEA